MNDDRRQICNIISEMLDKPDDRGIYPTTIAYDKLEKYIMQVRREILAGMYSPVSELVDYLNLSISTNGK